MGRAQHRFLAVNAVEEIEDDLGDRPMNAFSVGLNLSAMRNTRVVLSALGGPEVLKVVEDEVRDPDENELRIRILASGVAFADVPMRRGMYSGVPPLPYSPGYDIVGVVDSCGSGVTQWKSGDLVAALTQTGGYSRYIVLPVSELVSVPPGSILPKRSVWF
jgi:NADPH:quinone reductase-like Zn-dependent oxidoreductase